MIQNRICKSLIIALFLTSSSWGYEEQYVPVTPVKEVKKTSDEVAETNLQNLGNVKLEEYALDGRYRGGRNLIYDCDRDHYACVDDISKENCDFRRAKQEMHKKNNLSCAFFKMFPTKKECLIEQYKLMEKKLKTVFCFKKHQ